MTMKEIRQLFVGYLLSMITSWAVWCIIDINNYILLPTNELRCALLKDFVDNIIESLCLYCFSILSCKQLLHHLWNYKDRDNVLFVIFSVHVVLNAVFAFAMASAYHLFLDFEKDIFQNIMLSDYFVIEIISTTYLSFFLVKKYREEELARLMSQEDAKKKDFIALQTKLDMLSLQTNNHFIFNSFSTAASLVRHDPEMAERFIKRLSSMYRYMTRNGQSHAVPLADELEFVDNYIQMLRIRYSGIEVKISSDLRSVNSYVPPASLQTLIENAVKHNSHGNGHNLVVDLTLEDDVIMVTNKIAQRADDTAGSHSGIDNLRERYALLAGKEIIIENDGNEFRVLLPLVFEEDLKYEGFDN